MLHSYENAVVFTTGSQSFRYTVVCTFIPPKISVIEKNNNTMLVILISMHNTANTEGEALFVSSVK